MSPRRTMAGDHRALGVGSCEETLPEWALGLAGRSAALAHAPAAARIPAPIAKAARAPTPAPPPIAKGARAPTPAPASGTAAAAPTNPPRLHRPWRPERIGRPYARWTS